MITRLEIIERLESRRRIGAHSPGEFMYIQGRVPNSNNRLMLSFKSDAIRATPNQLADYYREVYLSNDQQA